MALSTAEIARQGDAWGLIAALVASDGSAAHPVVAAVVAPHGHPRDLADAVHAFCLLHGRYPGVIEHAAGHARNPVAEAWLAEAAESFGGERAWLARLTAAAGPQPSTPGQAQSEAAIAAQRHALDMLAKSDRAGCALGAAVALVLDWHAIRTVLDAAADRFGLAPHVTTLPPEGDTASVVAALSDGAAVDRAMAFGAQQLLAQHRGLWSLLEARTSARSA